MSLIFEAKPIKCSGVRPPRRQRGRGLAGQTGLGRVFMAPPWHGQIRQARVQRAPLVPASDAQRGQGRGAVPTEASQARAVQTRDRSPVPCPQEASTAPRSCRSFADPCLRPHPQHLDSGWGSGLVGQGGRGKGRGPAHLSEFGFCLLQTNLRPANSLCSEETGSLPPACTRGNLAVPLEEGHQCPDHRGRADPTPPSHTHRHLWSPSCRMCWGYRPWRAAGGQLPHEVLVREGCSFPCRGPCCWAGLGWGACRGAGHPAP